MISLNARSIRNKVSSVMTYVVDNHVDITLIQESWIRKCDGSILTEIKEYGYDIITYRKTVKLEWGGGVATIFRKNLKVNCIKCPIKFKTFEHVTCKVITETGPILIVNVYRRGYSNTNKFTVKQFIDEFSQLLDDLCDSSTPILIAGDINIHVELIGSSVQPLSSSVTSNERDAIYFSNLLEEYDLKQTVSESTHELGGTLDLAIMSNINPVSDNIVVGLRNEVCFSDHYHIAIEIPCKPLTKSHKITLYKRDLNNLESPMFMEKFLSLDLMSKVNCDNVNDAAQAYNTSLSNLFNEACPLNVIKVTSHKKQKWFNENLRQMKRLTRQAERRYKKHASELHLNELVNARNLYRTCIKETRSSFFVNIFNEIADDIGLVYKTANYYLDDTNSKCLPSCKDDLTLANDFTHFFLEKINTIRKTIENDPGIDVHMQHSLHSEYSMGDGFATFKILSEDDVVKLIGQMPCKLNSFDPIPLSYLKDNISLFAGPIMYIANLSLQRGFFPDSLKHGSITPILKSSDCDIESLNSYRPVTTLPFLSKFLEKAASSQIISYLQSQNLIPLYQSAYLKSHSCETSLFKFTNDVQQMLSERKMVILVQLDLSAAFDTVDHAVLLNLLQHKFGISGIALQWFASYLSSRSFSVKIGSVNGRRVLLIYGVPQGSILGPLLFILYIGDLPVIASKYNISFQSYADDSHLYAGFDPLCDYTETMNRVKECFADIEVWMKSNYLEMNVGKTEVLFIAKPHVHTLFSNMSITLGNECYVSSQNYTIKSLGAYFNGTMSINNMVSEVVKSCNFNLKKCLLSDISFL